MLLELDFFKEKLHTKSHEGMTILHSDYCGNVRKAQPTDNTQKGRADFLKHRQEWKSSMLRNNTDMIGVWSKPIIISMVNPRVLQLALNILVSRYYEEPQEQADIALLEVSSKRARLAKFSWRLLPGWKYPIISPILEDLEQEQVLYLHEHFGILTYKSPRLCRGVYGTLVAKGDAFKSSQRSHRPTIDDMDDIYDASSRIMPAISMDIPEIQVPV
ncbi:hypothetical protein BDP55DRAFT_639471 [Colletotrichum godetiae]|uniref:Uncharacterized protein n=1 Tax=Colletotrichum godetiae TaxID=1209918 RepID=A0AAJ0A7R8_9PEZI|nr:uncharacterized protein BDP55DRAFT_639471 [Colletotrichum godetiae]KAK1656621.1 hypothetical protein BDP55DRAFT_639471 [Colletotrichum godetiae]